MTRYIIGTILKFETVKKYLPDGGYDRVTNLGNGIFAYIPLGKCSSDNDDIPIGALADFDFDHHLWFKNMSETEAKDKIDELFSIDSKITYTVIF